LLKETKEFLKNESIEEIADILEVLEHLAKAKDYNWQLILKSQKQKRQQNGAFSKKLILNEVLS
jgi:predicted house-cleaning noncanonical NTP pyrophosphatase (MazG superfamily)